MTSVSGDSQSISPFGQLSHTSSNWQERMTLRLLVKVSHSLSPLFGHTGFPKLMENEEGPLKQKGKEQRLPHHGIQASCSRIKKIKCLWPICETFFYVIFLNQRKKRTNNLFKNKKGDGNRRYSSLAYGDSMKQKGNSIILPHSWNKRHKISTGYIKDRKRP